MKINNHSDNQEINIASREEVSGLRGTSCYYGIIYVITLVVIRRRE